MNTVSRLRTMAGEIDLFLATIALSVLITITFLGVFMRYFYNQPFVWLDEVQMILIIWITCFGASAAVRHGGHIAIGMLVNILPSPMRKVVAAAGYLIIFFILGFLAWNSLGLVRQLFFNNRVTDILRIKRYLVYIPIPLSALYMLAAYLVQAVANLRGLAAAKRGGQ